MKKLTVLLLDESDVVDSKKTANARDIKREDLLMPAYFDYVGAEVVVMQLNGKESVMKEKFDERQYLTFNPKIG